MCDYTTGSSSIEQSLLHSNVLSGGEPVSSKGQQFRHGHGIEDPDLSQNAYDHRGVCTWFCFGYRLYAHSNCEKRGEHYTARSLTVVCSGIIAKKRKEKKRSNAKSQRKNMKFLWFDCNCAAPSHTTCSRPRPALLNCTCTVSNRGHQCDRFNCPIGFGTQNTVNHPIEPKSI